MLIIIRISSQIANRICTARAWATNNNFLYTDVHIRRLLKEIAAKLFDKNYSVKLFDSLLPHLTPAGVIADPVAHAPGVFAWNAADTAVD
jgi:hypothetical protein